MTQLAWRTLRRLAGGLVVMLLASMTAALQTDSLLGLFAVIVLAMWAGFGLLHWVLFPVLHSAGTEQGAISFIVTTLRDVTDTVPQPHDFLRRQVCATCKRDVPLDSEGAFMLHYVDRKKTRPCVASHVIP